MKAPGRSPAPALYLNKSKWRAGASRQSTTGYVSIPMLLPRRLSSAGLIPRFEGFLEAPALRRWEPYLRGQLVGLSNN